MAGNLERRRAGSARMAPPPRSMSWLRRLEAALEDDDADSDSADDWPLADAVPQRRLSLREQLNAALGEDDDTSCVATAQHEPEESASGDPELRVVNGAKGSVSGGEAAADRAKKQRQRRIRKLRAHRAATGEAARMTAFKRKRMELAKSLGDKRRQKLLEKRRCDAGTMVAGDVQPGVVPDRQAGQSLVHAIGSAEAGHGLQLGGQLNAPKEEAKESAVSASASAERGGSPDTQGWHTSRLDRSYVAVRQRRESEEQSQEDNYSRPAARTSFTSGLTPHVEREGATKGEHGVDSPNDSAVKLELIPRMPCEAILELSSESVARSAVTLELCSSSDMNSEGSSLQSPLQTNEHIVSLSLSQPTQPLPGTQLSDVDTRVLELRESNEKLAKRLDEMQQRLQPLEAENAALRRQVEQLQQNNSESSDARLVVLLEEQVRGLQRRESKLMRALAQS